MPMDLIVISVTFLSVTFVHFLNRNTEHLLKRRLIGFIVGVAAWMVLRLIRRILDFQAITLPQWLVLFYLSLFLIYMSVCFCTRQKANALGVLSRLTIFGFVTCFVLFLYLLAHIRMVGSDPFHTLTQYFIIIHAAVMSLFIGVQSYLGYPVLPLKILFLRKFGNSDLNSAVRTVFHRKKFKVTTRLTTLDDSNFVPAGNDYLIYLFVLSCFVVVASFVYFVNWAIKLMSPHLFGFAEQAVLGESIGAAALLLQYWIFISLSPALLVFVYLVALSELRKYILIESKKSLIRFNSSHGRLDVVSSRFDVMGSPRARTVATSDSHWKSVVSQLAKNNNLIIMDLSEYSESIRWEVELLSELYRRKTIFLAHESIAISNSIPSDIAVIKYNSIETFKEHVQHFTRKHQFAEAGNNNWNAKIGTIWDRIFVFVIPSFMLVKSSESFGSISYIFVHSVIALVALFIGHYANNILLKATKISGQSRRLIIIVVGIVLWILAGLMAYYVDI